MVPVHGCHPTGHGRRIVAVQDLSTNRRRNREDPVGYKVSFIQFDGTGSPTAAANSTSAAIDIVSNKDLSKCPDNCFRPAGLAWDSQGRLYMSSDSTGEIFVITREDGGGVNSVSEVTSNSTSGGGGSATGTSTAPSPTGSGNAAVQSWQESNVWAVGVAAVAMLL
jgi:hypothetical protein